MLRLVSRNTPTVPYPVQYPACASEASKIRPGTKARRMRSGPTAGSRTVAGYPQVNPQVSVMAYGMVVLSIIVQGGLLLPVADLLRLRPRPTQVPVV